MSDSEFSLRSRSTTPVPEPKKKSRKVNSKSSHTSWYDDAERSSPIPIEQKKKSATTSEPSAKRRKTGSCSTKKNTDIFQIIREEEKGVSNPTRKSTQPVSTFSSRVSSGSTRRSLTRTGGFLIDLKVYKVEDYETSDGLERYKKALAVVKLQCEEKSVEWEQIQKFISTAFILFKDSEPTFFSNTKKYK